MRRPVAFLLATSTLFASTGRWAFADQPHQQQQDPTPPPPAPTPTYTPPPAPAPPNTVYVPVPMPVPAPAPTYAPPPPPPAPTGPQPIMAMPGTVPVVIRNDAPNIGHKIWTGEGRLVATCTGNCTFYVAPGHKYSIESDQTDELRSGKKAFVIDGPMTVDISPGSKSQRTTGLVLGITGSVATLVGLFGLLFTAASNARCYDFPGSRDCSDDDKSYTPWTLLLVAGIGATTAGWIMFGTSGTKMSLKPYSGPPVTISSMKLKDGPGALGLSFAF